MIRRSMRLVAVAFMVVALGAPLGIVLGLPASGFAALTPEDADVTEAAWLATADAGSIEILVVLREQADLHSLPAAARAEAPGPTVQKMLWDTAATSQAPLRGWLDARGIPYRSFYIVNALLLEADRELLVALARRPEVAQIMTNPSVKLPVVPSTESVSPQAVTDIPWGVSRIGAPEMWDLGYRGDGVVVAGQDTGYAWDHPALKMQYRGWDGATASHDYNWHDAIHEGGGICGADSVVPCDDNGHGTHTMGTIVGDDGAGRQIGVAPAARWIGCRNMSQGVGTPATYAECFEFFLAPYPVGGDPSQGDPSLAPHVINNSWSCPTYEGCDEEHIDILGQVIAAVREAGILVVASAGNRGYCGSISEPAGMYDAAFTVGASSSDGLDTIASFSSRGTGTDLIKPDLVAPGVSVESALPGGGYGYKSGTSMAAPHVAGAAALLWSALPDLRGEVTTTEILLTSSSQPYTSTQCGDAADAVPNSVYGWGRVDVVNAAIQGGFSNAAALAGTVWDADGGVLDGVSLRVEVDKVRVWTGVSDAMGAYVIRLLSGTYMVTASLPGYQSSTTMSLAIPAGMTTTLNVTLTHSVTMTRWVYLPVIVH